MSRSDRSVSSPLPRRSRKDRARRARWLRLPAWIAPFGLGFGFLFCLIGAARTEAPPDAPEVREWDLDTWTDVNDLGMAVTNTGSFAFDAMTGNPGLVYPRGSGRTAVFAAGLWMAARIGGDLRVSVAEYSDSYTPGPILTPDSWGDPASPYYRVYTINRGDTPQTNPDYDLWLHWPPEVPGAPPLVHGLPRLLGDQTLWSIYNDSNPLRPDNNAASPLPLGIQVRHSTFALGDAPNDRIIFLEWEIENRGGDLLEDAYLSVWSDPDLGEPHDDLVGCDTLRQVGFCYNATNEDEVYGATPPAVGLVLLQGPIVPDPGHTAWVNGVPVPDHSNLSMTSFQKYINGTDPGSPQASYNYMRGLNADGSVMIDPTTGRVTTFAVPGDPVHGTGWVDESPSDRRMMLTAGPFRMEPGAVQVVTAAILVGQGEDRLASVTDLRALTDQARAAFDAIFQQEPTPVLTADLSATCLDTGVRLQWRLPEGTGFTGVLLERDCGSGWVSLNDDPILPGPPGLWIDSDATPGALCRYRIFGLTTTGERLELGTAEAVPPSGGLDLRIAANPARGLALLRWRAPGTGSVRLEIFDATGRLVRRLYDGKAGAGEQETSWDGGDGAGRAARGTFFARLVSGRATRTERFVLMRE